MGFQDYLGYIPGAAGVFFDGWNNPAQAAQPHLDQMEGRTNPFYEDFYNTGRAQLQPLSQTYGAMGQDPSGYHNQMMGNYQQSPGFEAALQRLLQNGDSDVSAGGGWGTPAHAERRFGVENTFRNQDYNNWMNHVYGRQDVGLAGQQSLANNGQIAGQNQANNIRDILAAKANNASASASAKNDHAADQKKQLADMLGSIFGVPGGSGSSTAFPSYK